MATAAPGRRLSSPFELLKQDGHPISTDIHSFSFWECRLHLLLKVVDAPPVVPIDVGDRPHRNAVFLILRLVGLSCRVAPYKVPWALAGSFHSALRRGLRRELREARAQGGRPPRQPVRFLICTRQAEPNVLEQIVDVVDAFCKRSGLSLP